MKSFKSFIAEEKSYDVHMSATHDNGTDKECEKQHVVTVKNRSGSLSYVHRDEIIAKAKAELKRQHPNSSYHAIHHIDPSS